jgi:MFS family permease
MCIAAFLMDGAEMTGLLMLPFFVFNQLGGGVAMSGVLMAVHAAAYTSGCMLASGQVKHARNVLNWATAGGVIFTVTLCLLPLTRSPFVAGVLVAVGYGSQALVWPALHAWVGAEPDPALRTKRMGWFNMSWSGGFAVSPLAAGPLYDLDYRLPFVLLFVFGVSSILLLRTLPHERDCFSELTEDARQSRAGHDRTSEVFLYAAWTANFAANVLVGVTRAIFPKRVEELVTNGELRILFEKTPLLDLSAAAATTYSWLAFLLSFATSATFLALAQTHAWRHRFGLLAGVQAAAAAAFFVLGYTTSLAVMLPCFAMVGAALGVAFFSSTYYSVTNPLHKHRRATISEASVGMGTFLGSIVFGYAAALYGIRLPLRFTPVFILLIIGFQAWLIVRGRRRLLQN